VEIKEGVVRTRDAGVGRVPEHENSAGGRYKLFFNYGQVTESSELNRTMSGGRAIGNVRASARSDHPGTFELFRKMSTRG